jgi:hypothetical protein
MMEVQPHDRHQPFFMIMVGTLITVAVQLIMLFVVVKCRQFLAMKVAAELELKVAEKSVSQLDWFCKTVLFRSSSIPEFALFLRVQHHRVCQTIVHEITVHCFLGISNPNAENDDVPTMQDPTLNV